MILVNITNAKEFLSADITEAKSSVFLRLEVE